jgi:hypothetical protein
MGGSYAGSVVLNQRVAVERAKIIQAGRSNELVTKGANLVRTPACLYHTFFQIGALAYRDIIIDSLGFVERYRCTPKVIPEYHD